MNEKEMIHTSVLDCTREDLYCHRPTPTDNQQQIISQIERRRGEGEALQYILHEAFFMGLCLYVDERVLIPRPETEILVSAMIANASARPGGLRILDVGTGCGNIAIALARACPRAEIVAIDISQSALDVARRNARRHEVFHQITFICDSIEEFLKSDFCRARKFDMIIANPPYIPRRELKRLPADVRQEPKVALDGGPDGLRWIRVIIDEAPGHIAPGGHLAMEIGDGQKSQVAVLLEHRGAYGEITFTRDCAGVDRVVTASILS